MKLVHFTAPNGDVVPINPDDVASLRPAREAQGDHPGAKTVIVLASGGWQAVRETEADVEAKLERA